MTETRNHVAAFEHGLLRLWAFDGASETGRALIDALRAEPRNAGPADAALGAERIDPYWLDLVPLKDISDLGLAGYLRQGYDVPESQLDALELAADADHVLIAPSRAFADHEQTLSPDPALIPLAVLDIQQDVGALRPMEPAATARRKPAPEEPSAPPPGPPSGRSLRPGAIVILLIIAAAFIWIVAR